jgi:hypothetical protein
MTTKKIVVLSWAMRVLPFLSVVAAVLATACSEFSPETGRETTACMPAPAVGPYPAVTCADAGRDAARKDASWDAHHTD